jgi:hypothetical protein
MFLTFQKYEIKKLKIENPKYSNFEMGYLGVKI